MFSSQLNGWQILGPWILKKSNTTIHIQGRLKLSSVIIDNIPLKYIKSQTISIFFVLLFVLTLASCDLVTKREVNQALFSKLNFNIILDIIKLLSQLKYYSRDSDFGSHWSMLNFLKHIMSNLFFLSTILFILNCHLELTSHINIKIIVSKIF